MNSHSHSHSKVTDHLARTTEPPRDQTMPSLATFSPLNTTATTIQSTTLPTPAPSLFGTERPRLPPLSHLTAPRPHSIPSLSQLPPPSAISQSSLSPATLSGSISGSPHSSTFSPGSSIYGHGSFPLQHGVKRSFGDMARPTELGFPNPAGLSRLSLSQPTTSYPHSIASSHSGPPTPSGAASTPTLDGITRLAPTLPAITAPTTSQNALRCSLHVRQQPRAARAGPDGKDRRSIDPPPVLQLLMLDFDPQDENDLSELKSHSWVVHAKLVSAQSPRADLTSLPSVNEDGSRGEVMRLLLGTTVSSPFFCADDPDLDTKPEHPLSPSSKEPRAPSPTSRFLPASSATPPKQRQSDKKGVGKASSASSPHAVPCAFFIFADLSVRKAGEYRLEFRLMKMSPSNLLPGSSVPTIHSVTSQVFRVVNAKDFDQVQPSTRLVKGLLDRGAGFPLKLKKGTREGQRRKPAHGGSEDDDADDGNEEGEARAGSRDGDSDDEMSDQDGDEED